MIAVDSHTHIYPGTDAIPALVSGGSRMLDAMPPESCAVLFLCEARNQDVFANVLKVQIGCSDSMLEGSWHIEDTEESVSVNLFGPEREWIAIVRGQQIVTAENLEVLAVGHDGHVPHGLPLDQTIETARDKRSHVILPWGAGKWLSKRGRLIEEAVSRFEFPGFHLGDNGGRPAIWPVSHFDTAAEKNIKVLCGSDPLPIEQDEERIGSYASVFDGDISRSEPWRGLSRILEDPDMNPGSIGSLMSIRRFLRSQFLLRKRG